MGFIAYTEDLTVVSVKHSLQSHMFADDTQLYDSRSRADVNSAQQRLTITNCIAEVADGAPCADYNSTPTKQTIRFRSRTNLTKLQRNDHPGSSLSSNRCHRAQKRRSMVAYVESELTVKHIAKTAPTTFVAYAGSSPAWQEVTQQLFLALITSRFFRLLQQCGGWSTKVLPGIAPTCIERCRPTCVRLKSLRPCHT